MPTSPPLGNIQWNLRFIASSSVPEGRNVYLRQAPQSFFTALEAALLSPVFGLRLSPLCRPMCGRSTTFRLAYLVLWGYAPKFSFATEAAGHRPSLIQSSMTLFVLLLGFPD